MATLRDEADASIGSCRCSPSENGGFHGENQGMPECQERTKCLKHDRPLSTSFPLNSTDSKSKKDLEKLWRILTAAAKGFTIGAGLKGGLAAFSILARLTRRKNSASVRIDRMVSNREAVAIAVKETLRYGLFLGTFAGTFASVDECIAALGGHRRTASWRALLAGGIAGPSMLLTGTNTPHTSLAIYILMRAAVLASRCGIKSRRFGHICKPLAWSHGDIFLMCLSSSQILSAYILRQESLPPSYKSFLNKHGGKDSVILQGIKEIAGGMPLSNLEGIEEYYKATGVDVTLDPKMKVPCSIVHGQQSCTAHVVSFLVQAYQRALPVYLPVYLIPALIVHRQDLLKSPIKILLKGLLGTTRSSLFLSVYCSSACPQPPEREKSAVCRHHALGSWDSRYLKGDPIITVDLISREKIWTCLLFRIFKICNIPMVALGTFPAGLALAIEKKSRRIEISLYCFARALESFFMCMADDGLLPRSKKLKRADVVIFSLSSAVIMHCYAREREVFRSKYLNVLDWVFGVPPSTCETPRHKIT